MWPGGGLWLQRVLGGQPPGEGAGELWVISGYLGQGFHFSPEKLPGFPCRSLGAQSGAEVTFSLHPHEQILRYRSQQLNKSWETALWPQQRC